VNAGCYMWNRSIIEVGELLLSQFQHSTLSSNFERKLLLKEISMRNSLRKNAIVAMTMMAFSVSVIGEAQARIGSGSKSASASSRSSSSSISRASSSGRAGSGASMGMSRSGVMNNVRSQPRPAPVYSQPSRTAQTQNYNQNYRNAPMPSTPATQPSKRSWVAPAAAGVAAGALAGYALANSGNSQQAAPAPAPQQYPQQQAPAYADQGQAYQQGAPAPQQYQQPAPQQYQQQAPAYAAPAAYAAPQSSGGFGFGSFLLLALLAAAGFFAYRRYAQGKANVMTDIRRTGDAAKASATTFKSSFNNAPAAAAATTGSGINMSKGASTSQIDSVGAELMSKAETFYRDLQDLNNQGDLVELRNRVGDDNLFDGLAESIRTRAEASQTQVLSLQAFLAAPVDDEGHRYVGSVHYVAELREGPFAQVEQVEEVFHFVKDKGVLSTWKLAGIEQVEAA